MKIACAQINPVIADIAGNTEKIISCIERAKKMSSHLIVFPELSIVGYPPMDIIENRQVIDDNLAALDRIIEHTDGIAVIVGYVDRNESLSPNLLNSAAFIKNKEIIVKQHKTLLPTYDVFDEQRYFAATEERHLIDFMGEKIGITICEDIWNDRTDNTTEGFIEGRRYPVDPVSDLVNKGATLLINISASPFVKEKNSVKHERVRAIASKHGVGVVYVNQVGGNDSLIFDGGSFTVSKSGIINSRGSQFEEDLFVYDTESSASTAFPEEGIDTIEKALVLGIKDYCRKCGFRGAVLGLSGGIDSALTAVLAVKALGKENVVGVTMPSIYSSKGSVDDSYRLAENLGIRIETIPIKNIYESYLNELKPVFKGLKSDVTEENLQARIRGTLLMAISNKFGYILLTTGNKSELAMGYCTLYGDMNGGLAVISDLPKTGVYMLSEYINKDKEIIPRDTIEKAPSAELRENQKDQDTLPEYEILDGILALYIEKLLSREEIISAGYDSNTVDFVLKTVDRNEYKRRQAAPGLKITSKSFGTGRRVPMAMKLKH